MFDDVIACDLWFGPRNQKSWLRLWSGLHDIFCAIQKRGFLTCILCRKLPSKLEFYQKFQVNSLLSFRVKHFSAAATELLATMSNLLLLRIGVRLDRASATDAVDSGSNPGRVKPKTIKIGIHSFPA